MTLLSEVYDVTLKKPNRGARNRGFIRPTLGEFYVTHKDFQEVIAIVDRDADWDGGIGEGNVSPHTNNKKIVYSWDSGGTGRIISNPATPIKEGKWAFQMSTNGNINEAGGRFGIASIKRTSNIISEIHQSWTWQSVYQIGYCVFLNTYTGHFEIYQSYGPWTGIRYSTTVSLPDDSYGYVLYWQDNYSSGSYNKHEIAFSTPFANDRYTDYTRGLKLTLV